jgi:hypothetical protein
MKKIFTILIAAIAITGSSCVTSLQPLVTYDKALTDDRLVGTWQTDSQEYRVQKFFTSDFFEKNKQELEKDKEKNGGRLNEKEQKDSILFSRSYIISYTKGNIRYTMFGSLVKINGQQYINFTTVDIKYNNNDGADVNLENRLNTYTIARISISDTQVRLDFLNGDFIYKQVSSGNMKIPNERDDLYDTFLITASSEELQQFLQKYGNDKRFYDKENSTTLIRKS